MRRRQLPLLVSVFVRTPYWRPLVPMVGCSVGLLVWADVRDRTGAVLWVLRVAALLLAAGVTFALEDSAASVTAPTPTRLGVRRAVPVGVILAAASVAWVAVLGYGSALSSTPVPALDLTVELVGLLAAAFALAATIGGPAAGPALVVGFLVALRLPSRFTLVGGAPGDGVWAAAHDRWLLLAAAGAAALTWSSRDPASRWRR